MIELEKKHAANCGDLMSATSWQVVAAAKHQAGWAVPNGANQTLVMSRNRSL
jgi:hypothetical protein